MAPQPSKAADADLTAATDRVRSAQDSAAAGYDRRRACFDKLLFGAGRRWVCSQAEGDVLEIGIGTGRNLAFYDDSVRLTGVDLSPRMLAIAKQRAEALDRAIDLRLDDAQALELASDAFDTVVITLALCTIPDGRQALRQAHRVLRPGGRLLLLEHVRSVSLPIRTVQQMLNPLAVRFTADNLLRNPLDHLSATGFEDIRLERSKLGIVECVAARKPG